ncbi:MAG TPA: hypothetical protein PLR44_13205 [Thermomicrobiales bacterium]|nr:hypothetical protein [Thermomicrobiales bacterium]HRA32607.1 hypothetical protein [Thermomicrobiales bacterium]
MADTITIDKVVFARAFGSVFFPNPDDPGDPNNPWGPYGPLGPHIRQFIFDTVSWAALNPQPLPPVSDGLRRGPHPEPWRQAQVAGRAARMVIDQAIGLEFAGRLSGSVNASVEDPELCPRMIDLFEWIRRHGPIPPPKGDDGIGPLDYFAAGAQFQIAAETYADTSMSKAFATVAGQLFERGTQLG